MKKEKYYITCDLEKTIEMLGFGVDINTVDLQNIRNSTLNQINTAFDEDISDAIVYKDIVDYFNNSKSDGELIISLENGIYIDDSNFLFDSTRMYSSKDDILHNSKNYAIQQRNGLNIEDQIAFLQKTIKGQGNKKIVVCDDGVFSGDTLNETISKLRMANIIVSKIRVVLNFSGKKDLYGIPIESMYSPNGCIDWIDERDFFYGLPMGGASVNKGNNIYGIPYISLPEIAQNKASIPENKSQDFCLSMMNENIELWNKININRTTETYLGEVSRMSNLLERYKYTDSIVSVLEGEKNNLFLK